LSDFHGTISTARKHSAHLIDVNLGDSLANVLEETAVLVLTGVGVEQRVHCQSPNLIEKFYGLFISM
jgi:hypothetical protein